MIGTPARSAQTSSCSIAAARNVSAAPRITLLPSFFRRDAILPIVVVLPTPFTPITRITEGCVSRCSALSPSIISVTTSSSNPMISFGSVMPRSLTRARSVSQMRSAVFTPTSAMTSSSSSSSNSSSSIFVNACSIEWIWLLMFSRVFLSPALILSKKPMQAPLFRKFAVRRPYFRPSFSSTSCARRDKSFEMPWSCMVTPYSTSASSIVPRRWVIAINCVWSFMRRR